MEDKTNILFDQLGIDDSLRNKLSGVKLDKVKVNEKDGSWTFVLESNDILDIEDYKTLEDKANSAFKNIKRVYIYKQKLLNKK